MLCQKITNKSPLQPLQSLSRASFAAIVLFDAEIRSLQSLILLFFPLHASGRPRARFPLALAARCEGRFLICKPTERKCKGVFRRRRERRVYEAPNGLKLFQ